MEQGSDTVLGIDLGTSSVKVVLADAMGSVLTRSVREYPVVRTHPGWAETDPRHWWEAVRAAVREVMSDHPEAAPAGIGLSGQMHGLVLADAEGTPVRPAILWADARAAEMLQEYRKLGKERLKRLANPLSPGMAGPILAWLVRHEPEVLERDTRYALQPKDWLRGRLTGRYAGEPSDASATLLYDVPADGWDFDVVRRVGAPAHVLPELLEGPWVAAGRLDAGVAVGLWLPPGIPVAAGAADTAAAALGSGLVETGAVQLTIGTGIQIVTPIPAPTRDTLQRADDITTHTYRSAVPGGWYAMAASLTGGATLSWVREVLGISWEELYGYAERQPEPDDPVFVPYLVGERTPYLDPGLRGSWTQLGARHDRAAVGYAALEGVAFATADALDALPGVDDEGRILRLAGGGTTAPGWRRLLATVLDADLYAVDVPDASARGAALLGAQAAGLLDPGHVQDAGSRAADLVASPGGTQAMLDRRRERFHDVLAALSVVH